MLQALTALLFPQQLTVPLQTLAVPASMSLGQGQQHPAPTRADTSIARQNPPGINSNTCHAPWYCHRNAKTLAAMGEEGTVQGPVFLHQTHGGLSSPCDERSNWCLL